MRLLLDKDFLALKPAFACLVNESNIILLVRHDEVGPLDKFTWDTRKLGWNGGGVKDRMLPS